MYIDIYIVRPFHVKRVYIYIHVRYKFVKFGQPKLYRKRVSSHKKSGDEVYTTARSLLVIVTHLCSKLPCHKV